MNNSRKIAVDVIEQVFTNKAYSNIVLGIELNKSDLSDKDKALVTEIVYGTIKYKHTIDKILSSYVKGGLKKLNNIVLNILRISIYQLKYLDKIPNFAVVNEAVNISKKYESVGASKLVNGVLRSYLRNTEHKYCNENNEVEVLSFNYSFPEWMVKLFIKQYGKENGEKILSGLNERPALTVRVNSLKAKYEEVWERLIEHGYNLEKSYVCKEAIRIEKGKNVENNPLFNEGYITVQDESAMLVASSMELNLDMKVLDLCSAPGGKTTHMAELMNNTGEIKAFDIHENKLSLIKQNAERLGIKNIVCGVMDAEKYNSEYENIASRVLIDVPCSGLGIIRKKPEIKWNKDMKQLDEIVQIQRNIMDNASKYVCENGILLYSTCTLNKKENEKNIAWFIAEHPEFKIEPLYYGEANNIIYHEEGFVTVLPNEYMDGFFIAKLRKQW